MPKILIIDDEIEIRSILSSLLSKKGYSCIEAHSTEEARDILSRDEVALALVDVDLPGESGLTFLEYARSNSPDTILIMVTGMEEDDTISAAINAGIYAYILKPFNKNQLLLFIKNALRRREIEIENRHYREGLGPELGRGCAHNQNSKGNEGILPSGSLGKNTDGYQPHN